MKHCPVHNSSHPFCPACIELNRNTEETPIAPADDAAIQEAERHIENKQGS